MAADKQERRRAYVQESLGNAAKMKPAQRATAAIRQDDQGVARCNRRKGFSRPLAAARRGRNLHWANV